MSRPFFNLPNLLSLARIPLAAAIWIAPGEPRLLLTLLALAAITDWLDGYAARAFRTRAHLERDAYGPGGERSVGAWLDPLCDKIFVLSALVAVWVASSPPWWLVALIATRDLLIVPLAIVYRLGRDLWTRTFDLRAGTLGKATTVTQFGAVMALLLAPPAALWLAILAAVLGLGATAAYVSRFFRARRASSERSAPAPQFTGTSRSTAT